MSVASRRQHTAEEIRQDFLDYYNADDLETAMRRALAMPSTTPSEKKPRCPNPDCRSTAIKIKRRVAMGKETPSHQHDELYQCQECYHRFDEPVFDGEGEDR